MHCSCCSVTKLCLTLCETPWTEAQQASLSLTISRSLLKLMSIESVMPSNHLILCCPFSSCPQSLQSFPASESFPVSLLCTSGGQSYWSLSFSISPSNEYSGLLSFRIDWFDLLAAQLTQESPPAPQFKSIISSVLSLLYGPALTSVHDDWKNHSFDCMDFCW